MMKDGGMQITNEQAKSELMQIYGMLSEEKKQALDVLMAQNCDQCEVENPCLYCEYEFKAQADGEYISRQAVIDSIDKWVKNMGVLIALPAQEVAPLFDSIHELPSVDIPPEHDGCKDCVYQANPQDAMPCRECKQNYMDKWKAMPNKEGHWEVMYEPKNMVVCSKCGKCAYLYNNRGSAYCPHCGDYKGGKLNG